MKGQVSIEYLVIVAFLLIAVGVLFAYSTITLTDSSKTNQTVTAVRELAKAADQVTALGPENQVIVEIDLPEGIKSGKAWNKEVNYKLTTSAGNSDIWAETQSNISEFLLPTDQGIHLIKVRVVDENIVMSKIE